MRLHPATEMKIEELGYVWATAEDPQTRAFGRLISAGAGVSIISFLNAEGKAGTPVADVMAAIIAVSEWAAANVVGRLPPEHQHAAAKYAASLAKRTAELNLENLSKPDPNKGI